jgi:trk system potassium uptake protein TrkH
MGAVFRRLPFFVVLVLTGAVAMLLPAIYAAVTEDYATARDFFYSAILVALLGALIGLATQTTATRVASERSYLATLLLAYLWFPVLLALPMLEAVGNTRFINVYFDMVSALTTTGAPIFEPARLAPAVHLWRATVGWIGGALIWVTAMAVLAPLNLGGYEVTSEAHVAGRLAPSSGQMRAAHPAARLRRIAADLVPIYIGLTVLLALGLVIAGDRPLVAATHAMATLSTSGISPFAGPLGGGSGIAGEVLIFVFFAFALTRRAFSSGFGTQLVLRMSRDREVRLALFAVIVLPSLLFLRHWVGALEVDDMANAPAALSALWGSVFTVLSFLTTTGFVSEHWDAARSWSGLETPGILLIALVVMGGGVATTAGGLKLLRVYALYKHGAREITRLIHPHSVAGAGRLGRRIRREGAYIAWVFFMLFMLSLAGVMLALAFTGLPFESAMVLAFSALSTTGPLASFASATPISYFALNDAAKVILSAAMILGRMETLVLIAMFNPGFWRG